MSDLSTAIDGLDAAITKLIAEKRELEAALGEMIKFAEDCVENMTDSESAVIDKARAVLAMTPQ